MQMSKTDWGSCFDGSAMDRTIQDSKRGHQGCYLRGAVVRLNCPIMWTPDGVDHEHDLYMKTKAT